MAKQCAYIAGPMRGYDRFNWPAFDEAALYVENKVDGWSPISPADLDRAAGFSEDDPCDSFVLETFHDAMRRDLSKIAKDCQAILLLQGWQNSEGANLELTVANACGLEVWFAVYNEDGTLGSHAISTVPVAPIKLQPQRKFEGLNILEEANALVYGDRNKVYGDPFDDFTRLAKLWAPIAGVEVTPEQVALMMVQLKVARLCVSPWHRDSVTDIAGYAGTLEMVQKSRLKREAEKI